LTAEGAVKFGIVDQVIAKREQQHETKVMQPEPVA
jgi:ATP-dependent protease ClpP protease subunit